jgi:hypothetical protein
MSRGYALEEVMPCVKEQDGDQWTIDTDHESYPHPKYNPEHPIHQNIQKIKEEISSTDIGVGVGTELKKLLSYIGIKSSPTCKCNKRAKILNENGVDWAKNNISEISSWLEEEAKNRNLPYFPYIGKKIIKLAIHRASK